MDQAGNFCSNASGKLAARGFVRGRVGHLPNLQIRIGRLDGFGLPQLDIARVFQAVGDVVNRRASGHQPLSAGRVSKHKIDSGQNFRSRSARFDERYKIHRAATSF